MQTYHQIQQPQYMRYQPPTKQYYTQYVNKAPPQQTQQLYQLMRPTNTNTQMMRPPSTMRMPPRQMMRPMQVPHQVMYHQPHPQQQQFNGYGSSMKYFNPPPYRSQSYHPPLTNVQQKGITSQSVLRSQMISPQKSTITTIMTNPNHTFQHSPPSLIPIPKNWTRDDLKQKQLTEQDHQDAERDLERRFADALQKTKNIVQRYNQPPTTSIHLSKIKQKEGMELEDLALQYEDGYIYTGKGFMPQTRQGFGVLKDSENNEIYAGYWLNDLYHGEGRLNNLQQQASEGAINWHDLATIENRWAGYEGEFKEGKMHGQGILFLTNGERYSGQISDGMVDGVGVYTTLDGQEIQSRWIEGRWIEGKVVQQ